MAVPVGGAFVGMGKRDTVLLDLAPGRYGVVCFIPVGSVDDQEGDGPLHFIEGMASEVEVPLRGTRQHGP